MAKKIEFLEDCPKCGCPLNTRMSTGRKHQKYCQEDCCDWKSEPYAPKKIKVKPFEYFLIHGCKGFQYHIYDNYGYVSMYSKSYSNREEAEKDMLDNMNKLSYPTTGILIEVPSRVKIKGKLYKSHKKDS